MTKLASSILKLKEEMKNVGTTQNEITAYREATRAVLEAAVEAAILEMTRAVAGAATPTSDKKIKNLSKITSSMLKLKEEMKNVVTTPDKITADKITADLEVAAAALETVSKMTSSILKLNEVMKNVGTTPDKITADLEAARAALEAAVTEAIVEMVLAILKACWGGHTCIIYGLVYDEETEIGIYPCDVFLISPSDEIMDETYERQYWLSPTYENGDYLFDVLPIVYSLKFESPGYETKVISDVEVIANTFVRIDAGLKKKELITEEDSLDIFIRKAPLALKTKMLYARKLYKLQKSQGIEKEDSEK